MKLHEIKTVVEGWIKRSDPYMSGDAYPTKSQATNPWDSRPVADPPAVRKTGGLEKRLRGIAAKAGVSYDKTLQAWNDAKKGMDLTYPGAYAIVTSKTKRALGLNEAQEIEHGDLGSIVYGWKDADELRDEEDNPRYLPMGVERVLELGGLYANEPGKGQGTELMKWFLSTPEAQEADAIFLDPVPGLGANFKSNIPELEQIRRLQAFYRRFGFRNNPKGSRMWLFPNKKITDDKLPK